MERDLGGRTILITGASTGIGRTTALGLAARGAHLVLANRSAERSRAVLEELERAGGSAELVLLDLADLASVKRAAEEVLAKGRPIHVLVNNAGIAGARGQTKDGFEVTFGTNHLGPFLFTVLLLDRLRESGPARIVNVASNAHYRAPRIDWEAARRSTASMTGFPEYQVSKLANILFTKALAAGRAGPSIHSYCLHPGVVASDVWREIPWPFRGIMKLFMITNEEGAKTSIHCAAAPEVAADDGLFYDKLRPRDPSRIARDPALATELWDKSMELVAPWM